MKNVTCRKLPIDRIKAAQKLETLKDISLFGSFRVSFLWLKQWRTCSPLTCRHWKGILKNYKKKETTAAHALPIAGATGAATSEEIRPSRNTRYKTKSKSWGVQCPFCSTWDGAIKEIRFFWDCRHWRNWGKAGLGVEQTFSFIHLQNLHLKRLNNRIWPETQQRILPIARWQFFVHCH